MKKIIYKNNNLVFDKSSLLQKNLDQAWDELISNYNNWIANFPQSKIKNKNIYNHFTWQGMSTWWICPLVKRDTEINNKWIKRIFLIFIYKNIEIKDQLITDDYLVSLIIRTNFKGIKITYLFNKNFFSYYLFKKFYFFIKFPKLLKNFLKNLYVYYNLKKYKEEQIKKFKEIKTNIWFRTLFPANWIINKNQINYDRHFLNLKDTELREINYLACFRKYQKDYSISLKQILKKLKEQKNINIAFVESHLNIKDILNIYFSSISEYFYLNKIEKNISFRNNFNFYGINIFEILINEWKEFYFTEIEETKLQSFGIYKFLIDIGKPQIIISYGELFVQNRAYYFLGKKVNPLNKFIAVQHSMNPKNYGCVNNQKIEFDHNESLDKNKSPAPDYFFVQGLHYHNILKKFFPEDKIAIIGSLKTINYFNLIKNKEILSKKLKSKLNINNKKVLLITPSINDSENLIKLIKNINFSNNWEIFLSPHPSKNYKYLFDLLKLYNLNNKIKILKNYKTLDLLSITDLLVCGYSNLAVESKALNINVVRLYDYSYVPLFDKEENVDVLKNIHELEDRMENYKININRDKKNMNDFKFFYYKFDDKSLNRLWKLIDKLKYGKL